jgi:hypothetical protein
MDCANQRASGGASASCRGVCERAAHQCDIARVAGKLRDAEGVSLVIPHLLDHRELHERTITRTGALLEAAREGSY